MSTLRDVRDQIDAMIDKGALLRQTEDNLEKMANGKPVQALEYIFVDREGCAPSPYVRAKVFGKKVKVLEKKQVTLSSLVNSVAIAIGKGKSEAERNEASLSIFGVEFEGLGDFLEKEGFWLRKPEGKPTEYQHTCEDPHAAVPMIEFLESLWRRQEESRGAAQEEEKDLDCQGLPQDSIRRKLVEERAVQVSKEQITKLGHRVTTVGKPYDLRYTVGGKETHVEVKGSTRNPAKVIVTANEVKHARDGGFRVDLHVVWNIRLLPEGGGWRAEGGDLRVFENWCPGEDDLRPLSYECTLPV